MVTYYFFMLCKGKREELDVMKKVPTQRVNVRTHKAHKDGHKSSRAVVSMVTKAGEAPRHVRLGERTKGQSALATTVAEDELEERRRLFARARKGDKGAVAKIYELYGARIYTSAQVKEVQPNGFTVPASPGRRRVRTA
jgi:hypothetical protein